MKAINFPVFALGTTVAAGNKHGGGFVGVSVSVGDVVVESGDYIVGDSDGVIVVPQAQVEAIIEKAEEKVMMDEVREQEALRNCWTGLNSACSPRPQMHCRWNVT